MTAEYLLRFDDLCPTMDRERWDKFEPLLAKHAIRPILAVVPDNQDPLLRVASPDPNFWERMRRLQHTGAAIGLHGFQHRCNSVGRGIVPIHRETEFAGVPLEMQRDWIRSGLASLRREGLVPQIWVAPRHGMDWNTVTALGEEGIPLISDGMAKRPYRAGGLIWIPQQLWRPVDKKSGLWTICLHANTATDQTIAELSEFLSRLAPQFTSLERVLRDWQIRDRSLRDRLFETGAYARILLRRWRR